MGYTNKEIRAAMVRVGWDLFQADELLETLKLGYSNNRAYLTEERARDVRVDCMVVRG